MESRLSSKLSSVKSARASAMSSMDNGNGMSIQGTMRPWGLLSAARWKGVCDTPPGSAREQYCSARDLKAIFNFFVFRDLQKGTGDARIVRPRYHRKHLWIVTCYYKTS